MKLTIKVFIIITACFWNKLLIAENQDPLGSISGILSELKKKQEEIEKKVAEEKQRIKEIKEVFIPHSSEKKQEHESSLFAEFITSDMSTEREEKVFIDYYSYLHQHLAKYLGPVGVKNLVKAKFEIEKAFINEPESSIFGIRIVDKDAIVLFASFDFIKASNDVLLVKKCSLLPESDPYKSSEVLQKFIKDKFPAIKRLILISSIVNEVEHSILETLGFKKTQNTYQVKTAETEVCFVLELAK